MKSLLHCFLFLMTVKLVHLCVNAIPVHNPCNEDEQSSLLHLKQNLGLNSSASSKLASWNSSTDCCSWIGVTCTTSGHVVGLDISGEPILRGIDNSSSLFDLSHLQSLKYVDNGYHPSQIPSAVGRLSNLRYLNLSRSAFFGQIPIEISRLTRLVILDLSRNYILQLEKPNLSMLVQNLTELTELHLDGVNISAQGADWCQAISSSLPNMRVLSLSQTDISGPIFESLAKLQSLSVIRLDGNNISAPVPEFLANFSNLTSLSFRACGLYGIFPKEIFQVPTLKTIDLRENGRLQGSLPEFPKNGSLRLLLLSFTNFSGLLPDSIGNLEMLSEISLSGCNFYGSIPKSMANLTQLVSLDMAENNFNGSIHSTHWESLSNLVLLDLSSNLLTGGIPSSLFSLPLLQLLVLSNNTFSGQFQEFPNVSSSLLNMVLLNSNNLEGPIPMSIFNLQGLQVLSLSSNNFSGSFPLHGPLQLRNLSILDLSYNRLLFNYSGTNSSYSSFPQISALKLTSNKLTIFPDFLRNLSRLTYLNLAENQIHGEIPNWIWKLNDLEVLNLSCNSLVTLEGPLLNLTPSSLYSLDLHSNQLQGQFPIFSSPDIYYIDYSRNNFSSSIPTDIGDFLMYPNFFSLSSNNLHGTLPESICNSPSLQVLDLSNNSLSGVIPQCLTTMRTLAVLNLRRNNLTNNISYKFHKDCSLETVDLSGNQIKGQVPESLAKCTQLEVLNLGNNQITDTFPCLLKNISTLRVLVLRSNKFYGRIGCLETNGTWPLLQIIDLAHNNFYGEIPGTSLTTWQAMMSNEDDASSELNHIQFEDYSEEIYYQDSIIVISKGLEMELEKILTVFTSIDFSNNKFEGWIQI